MAVKIRTVENTKKMKPAEKKVQGDDDVPSLADSEEEEKSDSPIEPMEGDEKDDKEVARTGRGAVSRSESADRYARVVISCIY